MIQTFKKAFGGLRTEIWLMALVMFINRSGTMVILFMTLYTTTQLDYTVGMAGLVMALFGMGSMTGSYIGGKLTDKIGYYPVMYTSLISGGVMFLILGVLKDFYAVCLVTFLSSTFSDAFRPSSSAAIIKYSTKDTYTRAVGLNRLAINLGFSIGPAIGGFLAAYAYHLIFVVDGITCILAGAAIFIVFRKRGTQEIKVTTSDTTTGHYISPYRDLVYMGFSFFTFLYALAFFQLICTLPLFYKTVHFLSEETIGWLMALNGFLVVVVEMVLIYKIEKKAPPLRFIRWGTAILLLNYLLLPFMQGLFLLAFSIILISFSEMLAMPFMSTYMMKRSNAANRGQYAAVYSLSWGLAQIGAPLLSTYFIEHHSFNHLWIFLALICLAVIFGMIWTGKREGASLEG